MKKKHPEHVNLERWLVSYADFITLLFAFFVIMYAMSQADMAKMKKVSLSVQKAFSSGPSGMVSIGETTGGVSLNTFENVDPNKGRVMDLPAGKVNTAGDPDPGLQEVRELMEESVSLELGATELSNSLQMSFDSRGLVVRIAVKDFFEEGEVDVKPDLRPLLDRIGRVLSKTKRLVRLEGHTDDGEIKKSSHYTNDWELSSARAAWVAMYWLGRFEFEPSRIGIAGYSHYRPLARSPALEKVADHKVDPKAGHEPDRIPDKRDPWVRGKNRRVEIIVLNQLYEAP